MARGGKMKVSNLVVWILLGLLIIGLAGFGIGDFGGSVRSVGKVGRTEISTQDYARALQNQLAALQQQTGQSFGMAQARSFGIDRMVLEQLVTTAALDDETVRLGLSAGDAAVSARIVGLPAFQGLDGSFDREAYAFALDRLGLRPGDFEEQVRAELARDMLQGAVAAGLAPSPVYAETLVAWLAEERRLSWVRLDAGMLDAPVPEPTEAELAEWHTAHPERFTAPERREITHAWITSDMLLAGMEIDEAALRDLYAARAADYDLPERRIVDRLAFRDTAAAETARAALEAGETSFEDLLAERDLGPEDASLGEVARGDLEGAAAEAVFALQEPGIAGPVETALGPVLFRVSAVLNAVRTPFEEVREELAQELAADRARRQVDGLTDQIEDLLAEGATLEEVAAETPMELGRITFDPENREGIAAFEEFRERAAQTQPDDFPELATLEGGGLFALRIDAVTPPALRPLDEVRAEVVADWRQAETTARLKALAETLAARLGAGEDFAALGLTAEAEGPLRRNDRLGAAPRALVETGFGLAAAGAAAVVEAEGAVYVLRAEAVIPADPGNPETEALARSVAARARLDMAEDVLALHARALRESLPISLNATAIEAIHTQLP